MPKTRRSMRRLTIEGTVQLSSPALGGSPRLGCATSAHRDGNCVQLWLPGLLQTEEYARMMLSLLKKDVRVGASLVRLAVRSRSVRPQ